jgi:8-oxo-dGTP diphosphatase
MRKKKRTYCIHCGSKVMKALEDDVPRDFCRSCGTFFYENPLPVVSSVLVKERKILLVKRGKKPYRGMWGLPTGFAETGENIEEAALRELEEETGIQGKVLSLIDVDSCKNYFYGDLLFITFEVEQTGGLISSGSDTVGVQYFPLEKVPKLAFRSSIKAVNTYIKEKMDYWAIVDSFARTTGQLPCPDERKNLLSDRLLVVIEKNAEKIADLWVQDVTTSSSTSVFKNFDKSMLFKMSRRHLSHFGKWLGGFHQDADIKNLYLKAGREGKKEGFRLEELLSAQSILKKHIWEFALSCGMWQKTLDIYTVLELDRRIILFFDNMAFYTARGYEGRDSIHKQSMR